MLVVGGHSRKIGKSSVVSGLIAALPGARWTAIKITHHRHGASAGRPCEIREDTSAAGGDTGRYLGAGAGRAFLISTGEGRLAEALPELSKLLAAGGNAIIESNGIVEFVRPDLLLFVMDLSAREFKDSSRRCAELADAFIVLNRRASPAWLHGVAHLLLNKPCFHAAPPSYVTGELATFVEQRLQESRPSVAVPPAPGRIV